jgi:hypothetical protein
MRQSHNSSDLSALTLEVLLLLPKGLDYLMVEYPSRPSCNVPRYLAKREALLKVLQSIDQRFHLRWHCDDVPIIIRI